MSLVQFFHASRDVFGGISARCKTIIKMSLGTEDAMAMNQETFMVRVSPVLVGAVFDL